jgi:hypothetical protein
MQQAVETIGREADDVSGERACERARAVGASIRRARGALASALGQLDAGTRVLADEFAGFKRGCGTFAASLTTALEEEWWWCFYGRDDLEMER